MPCKSGQKRQDENPYTLFHKRRKIPGKTTPYPPCEKNASGVEKSKTNSAVKSSPTDLPKAGFELSLVTSTSTTTGTKKIAPFCGSDFLGCGSTRLTVFDCVRAGNTFAPRVHRRARPGPA